MMEYNLTELKELLQRDDIFLDYINRFFNLPGFSMRVTYNKANNAFTTDPSTETKCFVDDIFSWVHASRLPLFLGSDLFYEYRLCSALNDSNSVLQGSNADSLSSASSMYDFKKSLFQTDGESAILFWLDVDRLRLANKSNFWIRKLVSRIFSTYIANGSPFQLGTPSREELVKLRCSHSGQQHIILWNLKQNIRELVVCQKEVLQRLRTYWCQRYVSKVEEDGRFVVLTEHPDEKLDDSPHITMDIIRQKGHASLLKWKELPPKADMPMIIVARGDRTVAKAASHIQCHSDTTLPHLPEEVQKSIMLAHAVSNESFSKMALSMHNVPCGLISSSAFDLFSPLTTASSDSHRHKGEYKRRSKKLNLEPFLCASLRADFTTGNHFLRYLKKIQPNPQAINYMLFWQSIEIILTQDEMRRWFSLWSQCCLSGTTANSSENPTECPYLSYFEPYFIARNLKELCHLFLCPKSLHRVELPKDMEEKLEHWLRRGLGQDLLLAAQKYTAEIRCRRFSIAFRQDHLKMSISELTTPSQVAERTFSSHHLTYMWEALKYAEAIKYAGLLQLPSRNATDDSILKMFSSSISNILEEAESMIKNEELEHGSILTTQDDQILWDMKLKRYQRIITITTTPVHAKGIFDVGSLFLPTNIMDILMNHNHLECFERFLVNNGAAGAEVPLHFWVAVENLKFYKDDAKRYQKTLEKIEKVFLRGNVTSSLRCSDNKIKQLGQYPHPDLRMLIQAQTVVQLNMERDWFEFYEHYILEQKRRKQDEILKAAKKKTDHKNKMREAWSSFVHGVISFKRGLLNPSVANSFRRYLFYQMSKNKGKGERKVVGSRVIQTSKLLSDLTFWTEVEKYKDLVDTVRVGLTTGTHTPEDYITVHKKAHALVSCYFQSAVYPQVQINAPGHVVMQIIKEVSLGQITYSLFHEAALHIFSNLVVYWKKFCIERFIAAKGRSTEKAKSTLRPLKRGLQYSIISRATDDWIYSFFNFVLEVAMSYGKTFFDHLIDDGPLLSFSLYLGLRWIYPNNLVVYIPRSCWELEAIGLHLPEEVVPKSKMPFDRIGVFRSLDRQQEVGTSGSSRDDSR